MILLVVGLVAVIVVILIAVFLSIRLGRGDEHDDLEARPASSDRRHHDEDRWQDARDRFDRLLALRNDVGLLSEEYDPRTRRLVGNFPQAFTHVALVSSAFNLTRFEKPAEQRARPAPEDLAIAADA